MTTSADAANAYMRERMLFVPRMFARINAVRPEMGERFADYYEVGKRDGALSRRVKELIFLAIGVAHASPACLIHVVPAVEAGATDAEIGEALLVGVVAAGFVPDGSGLPAAVPYLAKALEIARRYRGGEAWEYVVPPEFRW